MHVCVVACVCSNMPQENSRNRWLSQQDKEGKEEQKTVSGRIIIKKKKVSPLNCPRGSKALYRSRNSFKVERQQEEEKKK